MRTDDVALALIDARLAAAREARLGLRVRQSRREARREARSGARSHSPWLWWLGPFRPAGPLVPGVPGWARTGSRHTLPGHRPAERPCG